MYKQLFQKSAARIIAASLIVMLALAALPTNTALAATTTVPLTGSGTWTVPADVTSIQIECWGGGGGGGSRTSNGSGGGGGGGAYARVNAFTVTPGALIPYSVGTGGAAGVDGGNTTFNTTTCVAVGGKGVPANTTAGGAGGLASASTGDVKYDGGIGYSYNTGSYGAGGGGSAGTAGAGNNTVATNATSNAGAVAVTGGGPGGAGRNSSSGDGSSPTSGPGGGGGGAYRSSGSTTRNGGSGAAGQLFLTFTYPAPTIGTVAVSPDVNLFTSSAPSITASVTSFVLPTCEYTTNGGTNWAAGSINGSAPNYTCTGSPTTLTGALNLNIRATNPNGTGTGTQISRTVDSTAPTDGALTVTPGSAQNILTWTAATDGESGLRATNTYVVRGISGATPPASCTTGGTQIYTGTALTYTQTGLTNGTQYSYRVCAYDAVNNASSGATGSGTPAAAPSLTSPTATAITSSTATLGANVTATGGGNLTARGTCWNTTSPVLGVGALGNNCAAATGTATGVFTQPRTGLTLDSKIYYMGYATNASITGYSNEGSFYVEPSAQASNVTFPTVTSTTMTINWVRGTAGANEGVIVLMKAGSAITGTPVDGTTYTANSIFPTGSLITDANVVYIGSGTSVSVSGLSGGVTYYVAVFEYNGTGSTSGVNQGINYRLTPATNFTTTPSTVPTVTTGGVTALRRTSATLNGTVNPNGSTTTVTFVYGPASIAGNPPVTAYPYTITANESPMTGSSALPVTGDIPGGLTPNTTYYYRVVGTNAAGTAYGSELSFKTAVAGSTTYYVNKTNASCSDSTGGTTTAIPFCTIGAAAGVADAGDTVNVLGGSYAETVKPSFNGGVGMPITFNASPGVTVTGRPDAPANATSGGAFRLSNKGYIVVNGFTVTGTVDYGIYINSSNNITISNNHVSYSGKTDVTANNRVGIYLTSTTYSTITGNTTDHNSLDGIRLNNYSAYNTISNNISFSNSTVLTREATGINVLLNSHDNTILHNIVYANDDTGLNFYTGANHNFVLGNLSYGNGDHGIDNNGAPNQVIVGNTIQGNVTVGINLEEDGATPTSHSSGGATLANNVCVDNGYLKLTNGGSVTGSNPGNIRVDDLSVAGTTLDYDLVFSSPAYTGIQITWGSTTYATMTAFKGTGQEANGLQADPLLVNPAVVAQRPPASPYTITIPNPAPTVPYNYHIMAGSPAIDSANSNASNEPTTDIEGNPRVDDPSVTDTGVGARTYDDRGAYEFQPLIAQVITFTSTAPAAAVVGGPTYTPTATGGLSGNPVVFTIDATASSVCSINLGVVSFTAVGTCVIDANQAGNTQYAPAAQVQQSFAVGMGSQTITFTSTAPAAAVVGGPTYTPTATGGASGNPVTFTIDASAASVCSINLDVVSFTAIGTCIINANQLGNANYNAAPQVQQSFAVGKGSQTITFTSTAPANAAVGGPTYTPTATGGGSGNPVVFSLDATSTGCSLSAGVVSFPAIGTCVIDANQAGNTNYNDAPQVQQSFAVGLGSQTITFTSTAPANAVVGGPTYIPTATGGASGNPVVFTLDATSTGCSLSAGIVSFPAVGTCVIDANQAGNALYAAAPQVQQSFTVGLGSQTITFTSTAPANAVVGGLTYIPTATGGASGNPVVFTIDASAASICSINSGVVSFTAVGACKINADQAGNANYNAAAQVSQSFAVGKGDQTIQITQHVPVTAAYLTSFTVAAIGYPSNLPVVYSATGVCTNIDATFTMTNSTGICYVHFNQPGDANYNAATEIIEQVSARGSAQNIIVDTHAPPSAIFNSSFTVAAHADSGLLVAYTASGACTNIGPLFTMTTAFGTCTVHYNQAGDSFFAAAPEITEVVTAQGGVLYLPFIKR